MGIWKRFFGYRWSLHIVRNEHQIAYSMHENSVVRIVGYVMDYFSDGKSPTDTWSLYLNFNHSDKRIKLITEHFTVDGANITPQLIREIENVDPGWQVKGAEPIFEETTTRKRLKISNYEGGKADIKKMLENSGKPRETTFFDVMDQVFGRR